jgi:hypothetical protein
VNKRRGTGLDIRGRIADVPVDQLLRRVDAEERGSGPLEYARSVVEYCSYVALRVQARHHDHLRDREFHSLTFDMMLAWEAPDEETDAEFQVTSIPFSFFSCMQTGKPWENTDRDRRLTNTENRVQHSRRQCG